MDLLWKPGVGTSEARSPGPRISELLSPAREEELLGPSDHGLPIFLCWVVLDALGELERRLGKRCVVRRTDNKGQG